MSSFQPNQANARLRPHWRWLLNALIAFHLVAIIIAPASVAPSSRSVQQVWEWFSPYLLMTNFNHGYHFFAPEPGPSTLLEYVLIDAQGNRSWGRMPDRRTMKPRLLYHRYFMLTEFLGAMPEDEPIRTKLIDTFAQQLMRSHHAESVELKLVTHRLIPPERVLVGAKIDDPDSYEETSLGVFQRKSP